MVKVAVTITAYSRYIVYGDTVNVRAIGTYRHTVIGGVCTGYAVGDVCHFLSFVSVFRLLCKYGIGV